MIVKRKFVVPGLDDISSDDDTDDEVICLDDSSKLIQNYETVSIDESMSDDDVFIVSIDDKKKRMNEVWRNIIECDLLDQRIQNIGLQTYRVNRDVESYDLPPYKMRYKRKKVYQHQNRRNVRSRLTLTKEVILISSSDDETEYFHDPHHTKSNNMASLVNDSDERTTSEQEPGEATDSDSEDDKEERNTWNTLIKQLEHDQFQIEFESGRQAAARKIATELNEPKIDLIDRCLIYLGLEKCQTFLLATKRIEENGGMPTKDGSRRRTPGGVFLTLIKSDRTIQSEVKDQIFQEEEEPVNNNESLWWKSVELNQYRREDRHQDRRQDRHQDRRQDRLSFSNYSRKKEFNSYTLIDLDYFECFKDFRYRYIPMMSNFTYSINNEENHDVISVDSIDDDEESIVETRNDMEDSADIRNNMEIPELEEPDFELEILEIGNN